MRKKYIIFKKALFNFKKVCYYVIKDSKIGYFVLKNTIVNLKIKKYIFLFTERGKNMPVFTESKKGYDKDEVNAFIKELNEKNEAILAEKDERIKELEDELKRQSKASAPVVESAPVVDASLDEAKKKYERLCADMGEKLLLAEVKASEIIDAANKKAEEIVAQARLDANSQVEAILEDATLSAEGVKKASADFLAKEKEIMALLSVTEETFEKALERISSQIYKG